MTFGEKLKQLRISRDLSQDEMAVILGTSKQVISRYEKNQRTPRITVATEYAEKLQVPINYLIDDSINNISEAQNKPTTPKDDRLVEKLNQRPKLRELVDMLSETDDSGLDTLINLAKMIDKGKSKD